jgi:hypothetical protein
MAPESFRIDHSRLDRTAKRRRFPERKGFRSDTRAKLSVQGPQRFSQALGMLRARQDREAAQYPCDASVVVISRGYPNARSLRKAFRSVNVDGLDLSFISILFDNKTIELHHSVEGFALLVPQ